jgi:hypothetical protein
VRERETKRGREGGREREREEKWAKEIVGWTDVLYEIQNYNLLNFYVPLVSSFRQGA